MKKRKGMAVVVSLAAVVCVVLCIVLMSRTQKIEKIYPAVIINIKTEEMIDSTTLCIEGRMKTSAPIVRDSASFDGKIRTKIIDQLYEEEAGTYTVWLNMKKNREAKYLNGDFVCNYVDKATNRVRTDSLGKIFTEDLDFDKVVIELGADISDGYMKDWAIIAPADNLDEALSVYQEFTENTEKNVSEISELAQSLYENKNPYIGNHIQDRELLSLLDISEETGDFTIELKTDKEPYVLHLEFTDIFADKEQNYDVMYKKGAVLFALIDNMEEFTWSFKIKGGEERITCYLNREQIEEQMGCDVREYADSPEKIQEYLDWWRVKDLSVTEQ